MAEELPLPLTLPLPLPVSSDTSPLCLNRSVNVANNDDDGNNRSQQPTLTLSPPLPAIREGPVNGSKETLFPEEQSLIRSPKKPKRSENPTSFAQGIVKNQGGENFLETEGLRGCCEDSCVSDEAATETSGGNREFVQVSDGLLNFDGRNEFAGFELGKERLDFVRDEVSVDSVELNDGVCGVERENFSNFEERGASCENCSQKQSGKFESEKKSENFEGNGSIIGKFLELNDRIGSCGRGSENQYDEVREGMGDSNLIGVAAGGSNGGGRKIVYSRKEMEALRFVNAKAQKKFWQEIRNGLEKTVKKEYDELGNLKHHKRVNRRQNAEMRDSNAQEIIGESSLEDGSCGAEIMGSCKASNIGKDSNDLVEEWSEQEDSDDEYESIQRPAFLVEGEPDFESGPPEDGLEYLRRVRWEAAHIPKVKVAKINNTKLKKEQSIYMPKIPDIEKCPPHLAPSKQWEDEFVADFSELRLALSRLEDTSDTATADPNLIIFCPIEHKSHSSKSWASLELPEGGPTLSTVLAMEPATRVAMLKRRISLLENASNLSKDDCAWLFALCAAVDTPLDADTCASLRCLLRRCAKLRIGKTELDDEVVMLNVLATISGKFFGQLETECILSN